MAKKEDSRTFVKHELPTKETSSYIRCNPSLDIVNDNTQYVMSEIAACHN